MNPYQINEIADVLNGNSYVGRGIMIGKTADGKKACCAYFIMGRSANSRNRIFREKDDVLYTEPFDPSKVEDPSLIIYAALRRLGKDVIVTNGDQTDTIYEGMQQGKDFAASLLCRTFEPDAPNFTPRISGILHLDDKFSYQMSILKSMDPEGSATSRQTFDFEAINGLGHFLHTYVCDGDPLPTFCGEPERITVPDTIDAFTEQIWNNLDADNKISLYTRFIDLESGKEENRLLNKYC